MTHNCLKLEKYLFPGISGCIFAPGTGGPGESSCPKAWSKAAHNQAFLTPYPPLPYIFSTLWTWGFIGTPVTWEMHPEMPGNKYFKSWVIVSHSVSCFGVILVILEWRITVCYKMICQTRNRLSVSALSKWLQVDWRPNQLEFCTSLI